MSPTKLILITTFLVGLSFSLISGQSSANETAKVGADNIPTVLEIKNEDDPEKKKTTTTTTLAPETPSTKDTSSTSTSTTTTTTTTQPTTTSTTTTTTTTSTSTTTAAPPSPPPNTTTVAPPITTTPTPAPYPKPSIGTWNSSCVMIKMAAQLNFTYVTKDNKNATALYNIPSDATFHDGDCSAQTYQTIDINWGPNSSVSMMLLQFDLRNKSVELSKMLFTINLDADHFPNAKENQTIQLIHRGWNFKTPVQMSYHCTRSQTFNLTETIDKKDVVGTVVLSDVQTEAFRTDKNSKTFSAVHDCDASNTSDIVPIAVGFALVALILIVLISYLCARRRSTSRGYMSF